MVSSGGSASDRAVGPWACARRTACPNPTSSGAGARSLLPRPCAPPMPSSAESVPQTRDKSSTTSVRWGARPHSDARGRRRPPPGRRQARRGPGEGPGRGGVQGGTERRVTTASRRGVAGARAPRLGSQVLARVGDEGGEALEGVDGEGPRAIAPGAAEGPLDLAVPANLVATPGGDGGGATDRTRRPGRSRSLASMGTPSPKS